MAIVSDNLRISSYWLKTWRVKLLFPTAHDLFNKFSARKSLRGNFKMLFSLLKENIYFKETVERIYKIKYQISLKLASFFQI